MSERTLLILVVVVFLLTLVLARCESQEDLDYSESLFAVGTQPR